MKFKKVLLHILFLLSLISFSGCSCDNYSATKYGNGSKTSPYLIYSKNQLNDLGGKIKNARVNDGFEGKYFKLMNDIDFNGTTFHPIGENINNSFKGFFDGNNYTIKNISINKKRIPNSIGLFGAISSNAKISNLNIDNVNIIINDLETSHLYVGGVVGYATEDSIIENCHVKGNISVIYKKVISISKYRYSNINQYVGGIAGVFYGKGIYNSTSKVNISAEASGGIVGLFSGEEIKNVSVKDSNIFGHDVAGGISAIMQNIKYEYNKILDSEVYNSEIKSKYAVGGFVGASMGLIEIADSWFDSDIILDQFSDTHNINVGGAVGLPLYLKTDAHQITYNVDIKRTIIITRIKINNIVTDSKYLKVGYFTGRNEYTSNYNESPRIDSSSFYGEIVFKNKVNNTLDSEKAVFVRKTVNAILTENNEVEINTSIIKNANTKNQIANYLRVDPDWLFVKDNMFRSIGKLSLSNKFEYLKGDGSKNNPYLIDTISDFAYIFISRKEKKYFKLTNNIDASDFDISYTYLDNGDEEISFELDGNNKKISNLKFKDNGTFSNAVFNYNVNNSLMKNITFDNVLIDCDYPYVTNYSIFGNWKNTTFDNVDMNFKLPNSIGAKFELMIFGNTDNVTLKNSNISVEAINMRSSVGFYVFDYTNENTTLDNNEFLVNYNSTEEYEESSQIEFGYSGTNYIVTNNIARVNSTYTTFKVLNTFSKNQILLYHNGIEYDWGGNEQ